MFLSLRFKTWLCYVAGTAHCANMYPDSPDDPPQLKAARQTISKQIGKWLQQDWAVCNNHRKLALNMLNLKIVVEGVVLIQIFFLFFFFFFFLRFKNTLEQPRNGLKYIQWTLLGPFPLIMKAQKKSKKKQYENHTLY